MVAVAAMTTPIQAADKYGVKDDAKFFSQTAVDRANQRLEELSKKHGANYKIETVVLPEAEKTKYAQANSDVRSKHFKDWATKRFNELGINERGGFILVVKSPNVSTPASTMNSMNCCLYASMTGARL